MTTTFIKHNALLRVAIYLFT